jgi:hypothetical protein
MLRQAQHTAFGLELAKLPDLADARVCVANDVSGIGEALILYVSGGLHTFADGFVNLS